MYGCFPVPPDDPGAALGVLFWPKDGFSTACGHGTMALAAWAVDSGLVAAEPGGTTTFSIDVPSGRVQATVRSVDGRVRDVVFRNVPSFVLHRRARIVTSIRELEVDVSCRAVTGPHQRSVTVFAEARWTAPRADRALRPEWPCWPRTAGWTRVGY